MVDICDIGEKIDLDDDEQENEENENNDKNEENKKEEVENKHPYGSKEWEKVEEEKLRKKSENRIKDMKEKHEKMDKLWEKNYNDGQNHIQHLLPIEEEEKGGRWSKKEKPKQPCPPPQLPKEKPLEKICDVQKYKACVFKSTADMHDPNLKPKKEENKKGGKEKNTAIKK